MAKWRKKKIKDDGDPFYVGDSIGVEVDYQPRVTVEQIERLVGGRMIMPNGEVAVITSIDFK